MQTYTETVLRYRVLKHEDLPEGHKEAMRARGVDPDTRWSLFASADTLEAAEAIRADHQADHDRFAARHNCAPFETYKVVDAGEAASIERPVY